MWFQFLTCKNKKDDASNKNINKIRNFISSTRFTKTLVDDRIDNVRMVDKTFLSLCITCKIIFYFITGINGMTPKPRYLNTCPRPITPKYAKISHVETSSTRFHGRSGNTSFEVGEYKEQDMVYYYCKEGYSQVHAATMYITCDSNGKWFPQIYKIAKCIPNKSFDRCTNGLFLCRASKQCVSGHKRCDCINDCVDGSDELGCTDRRKYIMATSSGRNSAGIITSEGYPLFYPNNYTCIYHIYTLQDYHLEIKFVEFDLPRRIDLKCIDFIRLIGLHPKSIGRRKRKNTFQKKQILDFLNTKCGKDKFKKVFSNLTHIEIDVSLGHVSTSRVYRGFSLVWKVRSKDYVNKVFADKGFEVKIIKSDGRIPNRQNLYNVLTAVAISAFLPLVAILFLCVYRYRFRTRQKQLEQNMSNNNEGRSTTYDKERSGNMEPEM